MRRARAPIFFIQAENDYDLSPSRSLAKAMQEAGKDADGIYLSSATCPLMATASRGAAAISGRTMSSGSCPSTAEASAARYFRVLAIRGFVFLLVSGTRWYAIR